MSVQLYYKFEPMSNGMYQVRLAGDFFVCYSSHKNEKEIDNYLRREGYGTRKEYFEACLDEINQ
ncbi:hypothetical protein P4571_08465 [Niallia alba]|uniref:hypothetical protein n=1 Tax=Niallia alba TaxID=2729105 RepID=UPI002E1C1487|nr:hypothetical protein [Niallia alba]